MADYIQKLTKQKEEKKKQKKYNAWDAKDAKVIKTSQQKKSKSKKSRSTSKNKKSQKKTKQKPKKKEKPKASDTLVKKKQITIWDSISVKELAEKMWVKLWNVMKKLLENQIMVAAHANIDFDTASLIWAEFGVEIKKQKQNLSVENAAEGNLDAILKADKKAPNAVKRAPIVTVMWHVDHGKTKLLDYIRSSDVTEWEAGGITQSIWASQVTTPNWEKITFIDTPGHSLFTSMRARGAKITDIAILVVAADDWVKKQTKEAIHHAKEAWVPILVAITKVDKENINIEMVKSQLSEHDVVPEEWWGDNIFCEVSWITGQWVDDLLESIALQSEMLDLKYDPDRNGVGVVLESNKDKGRWVMTSMIVMTGQIKVWDRIVVYDQNARVRSMHNWLWNRIQKAKGWDPIEMMWLSEIPQPGRFVEVVDSKKQARKKSEELSRKQQEGNENVVMKDLLDKIWEWETTVIKLVVKADSYGSLEALKYAIREVEMPNNIDVKIIYDGIGPVSQNDISLADASNWVIIWFNVNVNSSMRRKADDKKIEIKTFDIIYEVIDFVDKLAKWKIEPEKKEVVLWKLSVLWVFYQKWKTMVIWWKVIEGEILNKAKFRHIQENEEGEKEIINEGQIQSLQINQETVEKVDKGYECGMKIRWSNDIEVGDILEFYEIQEVYE